MRLNAVISFVERDIGLLDVVGFDMLLIDVMNTLELSGNGVESISAQRRYLDVLPQVPDVRERLRVPTKLNNQRRLATSYKVRSRYTFERREPGRTEHTL